MTQISTNKTCVGFQKHSMCHFDDIDRESGREIAHRAHLKAGGDLGL